MTDVSTALSTTPSWPADAASADDQTSGAPNSSPTLETAAAVLDRLVAAGWQTLSDRLSPASLIVIDHVAIGPGGIFVIDSHSFASSAVGVSVISDPDQPAKISAAQTVADAVRSLLPPLTRQYVVSVLAYADTSPMALSRGPIQICTTAMLEGVIAARHDVLSGSEIADIVASLDVALQPAGDGPRPAPRAPTPPTVQADAPATARSDPASTRHVETRRGRRFLGRRGDKAAAAEAAEAAEAAKVENVAAPVSAYTGPIQPPSPYPFVSPPVAAIPEAIPQADEVESLPVAEVEPEVIEPEATVIEVEPEVIEPEATVIDIGPEIIEPEATVIDIGPQVIEPEATVIEPEAATVIEVEPEVIEPEVIEPETATVIEVEPEVIEPEVTVIEPEVIEPAATLIEVEPEVIEPAATVIEPEVIEPAATVIEVEPEVIEPAATVIEVEPEIIEPAASHDETPSHDDVPLIDYLRDLRVADRVVSDVASLEVEESITEPEAVAPESIDLDILEPRVVEPEVQLDSLGYAADFGYDADLDTNQPLTAKPDEPAWEELSIEDLHGNRTAALDLTSSSASADTLPLDAEPSATSQTARQPGGRRKAPAKPWHRLVSDKVASAAPRRARQVTPVDESEDAGPVVADQPDHLAEPTSVKAFGFVDPTTPAPPYESAEPTIDAWLLQPVETEVEADQHVGLHAAIASEDTAPEDLASHEIGPTEQVEPEPVGWSIDRRTDDPWTPAPAIAPRPEAPSFASTSAASAWDTGLSVAVSRWKSARLGHPTKPIATLPADVELDEPTESADVPRSRKQNVPAAPTATMTTMPEGLSRRGQKMWLAMNGGDGAANVTVEAEESKPRGRTVRQLLVTAVIAGTLLMSSLHYTEISKWVSDHVDLPGIGESQDDPPKGSKNEPDKSSKPDADKNDPKGQPAGNN